LLAIALAGLILVHKFKPELLPPNLQPKVIEVTKFVERIKTVDVPVPSPTPAEFVAVLQRDGSSVGFLLTFDLKKRSLTVRRVAAEREPGKSYQLWLVADTNASPRSLGVVGAEPFTTLRLADEFDAVTINRASYGVSLEPQGGAPSGTPTGPMLYSGKLVQATPPGMASTP
jgi:anti-sigma-K factor RskA